MTSWAATVRWRDCAECLPHNTIAHLPKNGIAIKVSSGRETDPPKWVKPMRWPPRLWPVSAGFEGLPNTVGVVQIKIGFVRGYETAVWVFFGRPKPTAHQLRLARDVLRSARLPRV